VKEIGHEVIPELEDRSSDGKDAESAEDNKE
jgi:hypothetical protein